MLGPSGLHRDKLDTAPCPMSPLGSACNQPGAPTAPPLGAITFMCPGPSCSFKGSSAPAMGSACRALAGKWHQVWAAVILSLCMACLILCHEHLQAGDLVLPLCPAWAAISACTGNKSPCLPGGGCVAPAASAPISRSQITLGCQRAGWFCAACLNSPSSISVTRFCPRPSGVSMSRSSISQCLVPVGSPAREQSCTSPGCSVPWGAGRASARQLHSTTTAFAPQPDQRRVRGPRPNFNMFSSAGEQPRVFFAGNRLERLSLKTVSPDGVPLMVTPGEPHAAVSLPDGVSFPLTQKSLLPSPLAPTAPSPVLAVPRSQEP